MSYSKKTEEGQAIVEFALIMPILILLLLGVVYFAMAFNLQMVLNGAAREGARAWASNPGQNNPCCTACTPGIYDIDPKCDPWVGDNGFKRNVLPIIKKYLTDNGYDGERVVTTLAYIYQDDKSINDWNAIKDSAEDASKIKLTIIYYFALPSGSLDLVPIELRASYTFKRGS